MIEINLNELLGGEPMADKVYHVHAEGRRGKIMEKVVADDPDAALDEARRLLPEISGLYVSGPHELIETRVEPFTEGVKKSLDAHGQDESETK